MFALKSGNFSVNFFSGIFFIGQFFSIEISNIFTLFLPKGTLSKAPGASNLLYNDLATSEGMTSGIRRERRTKKSESPSTKAETTLKDESRTIASSSKYNSKQEDPKDSSSVASRYTQPKSKYLVRSEEIQDSPDNLIDYKENGSDSKRESLKGKKSTPSKRVVKTNTKLDALRRNRSKD